MAVRGSAINYHAASGVADGSPRSANRHDFLREQSYRTPRPSTRRWRMPSSRTELFHDEEGPRRRRPECIEVEQVSAHRGGQRQEGLRRLSSASIARTSSSAAWTNAGVLAAFVGARPPTSVGAGWLRGAAGWRQLGDNWRRQAYGGMLLDLEAPGLGDERPRMPEPAASRSSIGSCPGPTRPSGGAAGGTMSSSRWRTCSAAQARIDSRAPDRQRALARRTPA
jgi:hypothetical protein